MATLDDAELGTKNPDQPDTCPPVSDAVEDLPGMRSLTDRPSNEVDDVQRVIRILDKACIPACIVDVHALRYYGAGRSSWVMGLADTCSSQSLS